VSPRARAYFAIGELTQEDTEGLRSEPLAAALKMMRREGAGVKETMAAELHHGRPRARAYRAYEQLTSPTARRRVQEFGISICFQMQWFGPRRAKKIIQGFLTR
jgi:hypothetical protein